ncbi:MAG: GNAT family N-acetyltransferase [Kofleriaceae bacterium]
MIWMLGEAELPALCVHIFRHHAESGRDGDLVFSPRMATDPYDHAAATERYRSGWSRDLAEPAWLRTWGIVEDGEVQGHLDLHGGRLPSELHRATLGMGLQRQVRRRGFGRALIATAIEWARDHRLAWLDLGVFVHNAPARALYQAMGFVEIGTTRDQFRVDGRSIDDIAMTLKL